jgi:hypothetical protein
MQLVIPRILREEILYINNSNLIQVTQKRNHFEAKTNKKIRFKVKKIRSRKPLAYLIV